ncbi:circadian regulator cryptochrome [Brevipalpus obovatus]|uniref:circadian regulator cryptochrome n=1 Tax=Brevipalpus obovatus TaxID=246614 RepID=UPI003D9E9C4D
MSDQSKSAIHWFRHGLRLSDMPSLYEASKACKKIYPIFIFDGMSAGTLTIGFNRMRYLLECLADLDDQFKQFGGRLYVFHGNSRDILQKLITKWSVGYLSFEQDPEPIWKERDDSAKELCNQMGVQVIERISHTLWDPLEVIATNGGQPPLNYELFCHTVEVIGQPNRPLKTPDFKSLGTQFPIDDFIEQEHRVPASPEILGIEKESKRQSEQIWFGGETKAKKYLADRLECEREAFEVGDYLPTQMEPNILEQPKSLSPALRHGCLSVREFYWAVNDLYDSLYQDSTKPRIVGQLIWREFFYTMSVNNLKYGQMVDNPVCLQIQWQEDERLYKAWEEGNTGFPFIDAAMRQLVQEGWIHHAARNAVSCFLTRGDLWITWEKGLTMFLRYLLDADWSVCAGNWMWISSSAFDNILQSNLCISPVMYGRWLEPTGNYIRKYVPELASMPLEYLFEPWKAPREVQEKAKCIVGVDYPVPIVDHDLAFQRNRIAMELIKKELLGEKESVMTNIPKHIAPSHASETRFFLCLTDRHEFCSNLAL